MNNPIQITLDKKEWELISLLLAVGQSAVMFSAKPDNELVRLTAASIKFFMIASQDFSKADLIRIPETIHNVGDYVTPLILKD